MLFLSFFKYINSLIIFLMSVLYKAMVPIIILLLLTLTYITISLDQYCWLSIQFVLCFNAPTITTLQVSVLSLYCIRLANIWSWPKVHGDIWSTLLKGPKSVKRGIAEPRTNYHPVLEGHTQLQLLTSWW